MKVEKVTEVRVTFTDKEYDTLRVMVGRLSTDELRRIYPDYASDSIEAMFKLAVKLSDNP